MSVKKKEEGAIDPPPAAAIVPPAPDDKKEDLEDEIEDVEDAIKEQKKKGEIQGASESTLQALYEQLKKLNERYDAMIAEKQELPKTDDPWKKWLPRW